MIDISLKIEKDNKVWDWFKTQENKLISAGHIGTHIDVYKRSEVPTSYMESRGIVLDCTKYSRDVEIGLEVLSLVDIKKGDFVIFKTNIGEKYPYGSDVYVHNHNQLSDELIDYLINKKVNFIGIDCAGIRRGKEHFKADVRCEENGVYVVENLDVSKINNYNKGLKTYTVWIDNLFATGLSTRVLIEE